MITSRNIVKKQRVILRPDSHRVVGQFFNPGNPERMHTIARRTAALTEIQSAHLIHILNRDFGKRHRFYQKMIQQHFNSFVKLFPEYELLPVNKKILIGAYLSKEYSFESTALMNPSMVYYDQHHRKSPSGEPFMLSLRAVGEGHISSVTFRSGTIRTDGSIRIEKKSMWASLPEEIIYPAEPGAPVRIRFSSDLPPSEKVIFPLTADECNGIEDVRLVRFINDNGSVVYYGTYTAYDGKVIKLKLLETTDFESFKIYNLQGAAVLNKGLALFPQKSPVNML